MNGPYEVSEETLNAFVDGQVDADEKSRIFSAINADKVLGQHACELRKLQEMVRHAYDEPPRPTQRYSRMDNRYGWTRAVAAGLLLAFGISLGWFAHGGLSHHGLQAMYLDDESSLQAADLTRATEAVGKQKIILHLSSSEPAKIEEALNTAENLLRSHRQDGQTIEVELVANSGGLKLLRSDVSPYAQRVSELQLQYDNLTFMACQTAIARLQRERGLDVKLLPEALTTPNALEQSLTRLQQGWVYIKV